MNTLHNLSQRLLASLALILPLAAPTLAQETTYEFDESTNTLTITGSTITHAGTTAYQTTAAAVVFNGNFTSIPDKAFYSFSALKSITIPEGVESIGKEAFYSCDQLESISLPSTLTSLGEDALRDCYKLKSISLPDGITEIKAGTFTYNEALSDIKFPANLKTIGENAFYLCAFTSIEIPASVTNIADLAFYECSNLKIVSLLPDYTQSVPSTPQFIYLGSDNNTNTTDTGDNVFPSDITVVYDPDYTNIGDSESENIRYYAYTVLTYEKGTGWYYNPATCTLSIYGSDPDWATIHNSYREKAKQVEFTSSFKCSSIPENSFDNFSQLTSITIPKCVTKIEQGAFHNCENLSSVTFLEGTTTIEQFAFGECKNLTTVTFPASLQSIGESAFDHSGLTSLTFPASSSLQTIGNYAFDKCSNLESIVFPASSSLQSIGECAFASCSNLKSIVFPASLQTICNYAFTECNDLKTVEVLNNGMPGSQNFICLGTDNTTDRDAIGEYIFTASNAKLIYNSTYTYVGKKNDDGSYTNLLRYLTPQDPTSLHTPAASTTTPALYYDLTGRPVNPATHHGITILKQGNNAKLSIIK